MKYRSLINSNKATYLISTKEEKTDISRSIVAAIREQQGRFLERGKDKIWYDIGDAKATEKTSQALREGQPNLRQKMIDKGIIKDPYTSPPGIVEIVNPQSKTELVAMAAAASTLPDNNCHTKNVPGHRGSNLFATDYISIIGHNNNQYPQSMGYSLDHHLLEKNKTTFSSNQNQRIGVQYPCDDSDQQKPAFIFKNPPEDCEDTTMVHSTHHHSNSNQHHSTHLDTNNDNSCVTERGRVDDADVIANRTDLDGWSSHSIMTFDIEIDNDDFLGEVDLIDDDDTLPPNYHRTVNEQGNDDETINYSEKTYHTRKSLFSNSQRSGNDSRSHHHHHHHHNHQHPHNNHLNRYFEYENEHEHEHEYEHGNASRNNSNNNNFEDVIRNNDGEEYNDDDSGIISLGFLSSVMSPTTETNPHRLLEKRRTLRRTYTM